MIEDDAWDIENCKYVANQRPLATSYRTRGSDSPLKLVSTPKKLRRLNDEIFPPSLSVRRPTILTISKTSFEPTATPLSGGSKEEPVMATLSLLESPSNWANRLAARVDNGCPRIATTTSNQRRVVARRVVMPCEHEEEFHDDEPHTARARLPLPVFDEPRSWRDR